MGEVRKGDAEQDSSRSDYESMVYNDPVELLRAIREHALNYQETRYEMAIIAESMITLLTSKQKENESLQDYTRRFKTAREVFESHIGGPIVLTKYMMTMDDYNDSDPTKLMCACGQRQSN